VAEGEFKHKERKKERKKPWSDGRFRIGDPSQCEELPKKRGL